MLRHSFSFCKTVATYYHNNSCDTSSMESRLFLERVNKCFVTQHVTDLTTDNSVLDLICSKIFIAFSALTLLVGRQEGHPACKKAEWWGIALYQGFFSCQCY